MDVRTMRRVVDDVQAGFVPRVAVSAAARWNGTDPAHVRSSANHVFRFLRDGRPHYLRITPDSERGPDAILAELDFVLHATAGGLAVARPIPSTARGALVEDIDDGGQRSHAVVFEALRGRQHDWNELDEPMVRAWGRALARLHRASETFPIRGARADWPTEIRAALATLPAGETAVAGVLEAGLAWLGDRPEHERGLLHGDFELDNLFWDGVRVQVLDFDAACYGDRGRRPSPAIRYSSTMSEPVEVRGVSPRSWPDVEHVLGRGGQVKHCWCMWFRLRPAEWRVASGEDNRQALRRLADDGRTPGLLAYRGAEPVGWCSVAPRTEFLKLTRSLVARPVDDAPVWSLVCLYVVPGSRGLGVARALVRAACAHAADRGARIVEAYPVDDSMGPVSSDDAYHGVVSLLRSEGFTEVARHSPRRPLMRRDVLGLHSGAWTPAPE